MKPFRILYGLMRPHSGVYGAAMALLIAATACYLFLPIQVGKFLDSLHAVSVGGSGAGALRAIIIASALLILNGILNLAQSLLITFTSEKIINGLRARFFSHVMRQSLDESLLRPLGQIASEFSSDLSLIQDGISVKVIDFLRNAIFTVGALAAIFYIDFRMTLFALAAVILVAGVMLAFMRSATKAIISVQQQRAKLVSVLVESASNAYVIQAFGRIEFMEGRFAQELRRTFERIRKHALLMAAMSPVSLIVFSCLMVGAIAFGVEELRA
ncbi:MAG: ABC transporter ATP-binding protein, partial [Blastocatellia bacterium]|nr:ABC transporter ATP-binding protein [Blastocatellia bacterium]